MSTIIGIERGEEALLSYEVATIKLASIVHDGVVTEVTHHPRSGFIIPSFSEERVKLLHFRYMNIEVRGSYNMSTGVVKIEGTGFGRVNLAVVYDQP